MVADVKISVGWVVAALLWAASLGMWGVGSILNEPPLRGLAIIVCAAGATATVRMFFVRQSHMLRDAFELGRDAAGPWPHDVDDGTTPLLSRR